MECGCLIQLFIVLALTSQSLTTSQICDIKGTPLQTGSCDFTHGTCGYTLDGFWKRITGQYKPYSFFGPTYFLNPPQKSDITSGGYYVHFDPNGHMQHYHTPDNIMTSPLISPGNYCLSFRYVKSTNVSSLTVSIQPDQGAARVVLNDTSGVSAHVWTQASLQIHSMEQFKISFHNVGDYGGGGDHVVGIDDIHIGTARHVQSATHSNTLPITWSCSFTYNETCNMTYEGLWGVHMGPSLIHGHPLIRDGQDDAYYAFFDPSNPSSPRIPYSLTSPTFHAGTYNLTFWYILPTHVSNVQVYMLTGSKNTPLGNLTGNRTWIEWVVNIGDVNEDFQILFVSKNTGSLGGFVGVDDIAISGWRILAATQAYQTTEQTTSTQTDKSTTPTTTSTTPTTTSTTPTTTSTTQTTTPTTPTTTSTTPTTTSTTPTTTSTTPTTTSTTPTTTSTTPTTTSTTPTTTSTTQTTTSTTPTTTSTTSTTTSTTPTTSLTTKTTASLVTSKAPTSPICSTDVCLEDVINHSCTTSQWNVTVNMTLLNDLYPHAGADNIFLGDNICTGHLTGDILTFSYGLRECQTSEKISDDSLIYENDLMYVIYDPINPFIIRQHAWTFTVECDVTRNDATSSHVHHEVEHHHETANSSYSINLKFYKDPNFREEIPGNPLNVNVGDNVYVKVMANTDDWGVKLRLHTCYTSPSVNAGDNMKYFLIRDGCETDRNTHIISQSSHETTFVFQDFEYASNHEGLDLSCSATFCDSTDYSAQCQQMCRPAGPPIIG